VHEADLPIDIFIFFIFARIQRTMSLPKLVGTRAAKRTKSGRFVGNSPRWRGWQAA
jgi:hypothetical protein